MQQGSCLCGAVRFTLSSEPTAVTHCHCRMCQKKHGAAFATYASVPLADRVFDSWEDQLHAYKSSPGVERQFCCHCGSTIHWFSATIPQARLREGLVDDLVANSN